jgi:hypothetical protein
MKGIALSRCRKSDGMIFYCPHKKQLYTSSDYELDEGCNTPTTFDLHYDGDIFIGLYKNQANNNSIDPFPKGTSVLFPRKDPRSNDIITMHGTAISVYINTGSSQVPINNATSPLYIIRLGEGSTHNVSPDYLSTIVSEYSTASNKIRFPT